MLNYIDTIKNSVNIDRIKNAAFIANRNVQENFSFFMAVTGGVIATGALTALAAPVGLAQLGVYGVWSGMLATGLAVAGKVGYDKADDYLDSDYENDSEAEDESFDDEEEVKAISAATLVKDFAKGITYRANRAAELAGFKLAGDTPVAEARENQGHGYNLRNRNH